MADEPKESPAPAPASTGWTPTTSTLGGGILGGAIGQVAIALIEQFSHAAIGSATAGAISTICVFAVGYFFPDGGRK